MSVSFIVYVHGKSPKINQELTKIAKIRFELHSINAYVLEFIPQGRTCDEITQSYENFIKKLKSYEFVKQVNVLSGSLLPFDG